ncbi:hypothetical protein [Muricoccus radiodurans]|uniref:hypothetical protein n=1 Tax=Muricoccus radiodurans TaxID=2231721 RepID=UPI003CEF5BC1
MADKVMVRAYRGEPVEMMVCDVEKNSVYAARPERLRAVATGESRPVGFPGEDVFCFDAALFSRLREEWRAAGQTNDGAWEPARPYLGHTRI